ncbi:MULTISPECIES: carbohydrate ABC transporter permease [unclassified Streptomyces]|jgi:multiple sugar transport system permease protein|uniref:carbohydrate ABC transporter permease n=1 Tax=Streptomyces TaxID=1883 RepID=UPI0019036A68|nr:MULTISPECIES: carbohydrate ABC transporter permease [unclassified Streptomyces]MCU4749763.1 carbohydrate ABC transporter permease [Streptomyces sp. G-5]QQN76072.1 carbohydrate ABC transporter permease [Streptomyces sp. XC 2026]
MTDTSPKPVTRPRPAPEALPDAYRGRRLRRRAGSVLKHTGLIIVALLMLYPLLWMVASSLRPNADIFTSSGLFVDTFDLDHYPNGWNALAYPFSTYLLNSFLVVLGSVIGNLVSCSMAAYAFARLQFRWRRWAFMAMLVTIMLPIHVLIIPQYVVYAQLGWINTYLPLIVPKLLATDAFFIFLMVQFIRGIPRELDEAARIDGAGHARIYGQIMLPLMVPALATTAIFTFIWTWNDFFTQLIFVTKPDLYTVPVALRSFIDAQTQSDFGAMFAMSVVSLIPVFLVFLFGQRFLLRGIATTGGK